MHNLHGTLDLTTLPVSLLRIDLSYCSQLYINFSNLTELTRLSGLTKFLVSETNAVEPYTFDWNNLASISSLEYLEISSCGLKGAMNITKLPNDLLQLFANDNQFDDLLLPARDMNNSSQNVAVLDTLWMHGNEFNNNISE